METRRILIVEDEAVAAISTKLSLMDLGYEIVGIVMTGEEAVDVAGRTLPDLVLMDIILAGKMDGIEAAEQISKRFKVPVVYVTAHTDKSTLVRANSTNPAGFLEKPVEDYEWDEVIRDIFGST
jgi:CheY-like chemotaxis protein